VADESFYPLPLIIENSFDASSALVVEADVANIDQKEIQKVVMAKGMYAGDDDLTKHISTAEYNELEAYTAEIGLPIAMLNKMKPWLIIITIAALKVQKEGLKTELVIDMHFLKKAKKEKKILELEGALGQIDLINGFSDKEQPQFLKKKKKS